MESTVRLRGLTKDFRNASTTTAAVAHRRPTAGATYPNVTRGRRTGRPTDDADVVVVGARCGGAATAMLLADRGHDVVLLDRAAFPSDTLSTHALARTAVVQLQRWGLLETVVASGAPPIRDVVFHTEVGGRGVRGAGAPPLTSGRVAHGTPASG